MTYAALLLTLLAIPTATNGSQPILLDFHASWCGPCREMRPAVDQLIKAGYPVKSIDIDANEELAARYEITGVPSFVVVDAQGEVLARTSGLQPASQIATLYRDARQKLTQAQGPDERRATGSVAAQPQPDEAQGSPPSQTQELPRPWETVVRIKVHGAGSIGFGSGTIIHSTPEESLILTCAHIFQMDGKGYVAPSRFPRPVEVDLFDGQIRTRGQGPGQLIHNGEKYRAEVIDYDFVHDVGLIRIRPGRRLPASPVVPPDWKPARQMEMITVGCSEGRDATAWSTTITNPLIRGLQGRPTYEAIECSNAPKQGRSGGGLYTSDGYLAGVCDFAEPQGNHGLYATPRSIYRLLDKNQLMALYRPELRDKTLLAEADSRPAARSTRTRRNAPGTVARAQSPEREEGSEVLIPSPELLGIRPPSVAADQRSSQAGRRGSWESSTAAPRTRPVSSAVPETITADMRKPPGPGDDLSDITRGDEPDAMDPVRISPIRSRRPDPWRAVKSSSPASAALVD